MGGAGRSKQLRGTLALLTLLFNYGGWRLPETPNSRGLFVSLQTDNKHPDVERLERGRSQLLQADSGSASPGCSSACSGLSGLE